MKTSVSVHWIIKEVQLLVVPTIQHAVILGVDFCNLFSIALEFSKSDSRMNAAIANVFPVNKLEDPNNLTVDQKIKLQEIITLFEGLTGKGCTSLVEHKIGTVDKPSIKQRYYPVSPTRRYKTLLMLNWIVC